MKFLLKTFVAITFLLTLQIAAQTPYKWLDAQPLPSWSERSRAILQTEKISSGELIRCRSVIRPASLPVDRLLTNYNWTLVGDAQVFGQTTTVTVAAGFDGQCRPRGFQTLVFVGNRVAGTLSPGPMDARTDSSLTNVKLLSEKSLVADYIRYQANDALCCPSKIDRVTFKIEPDGRNWLLKPDFVTEAAYNISAARETVEESAAPILANTSWRWTSLQTSTEKIEVPQPGNYTIAFAADGRAQILADCNRGNGSYQLDGKSIAFPGFATTKKACAPGSLDNRFLQSLSEARSFRIEGNNLLIDLANNSRTMTFIRVFRQNQTTQKGNK